MVYLGMAKPFKQNSYNTLEIFNESSIFVMGVSLVAFTDYNMDPVTRYRVGWVGIGVVIINCIITLGFSLYHSLRCLINLIRRVRERKKNKKDSLKTQQYMSSNFQLQEEQKSDFQSIPNHLEDTLPYNLRTAGQKDPFSFRGHFEDTGPTSPAKRGLKKSSHHKKNTKRSPSRKKL